MVNVAVSLPRALLNLGASSFNLFTGKTYTSEVFANLSTFDEIRDPRHSDIDIDYLLSVRKNENGSADPI